jgi:hypothetical protein
MQISLLELVALVAIAIAVVLLGIFPTALIGWIPLG